MNSSRSRRVAWRAGESIKRPAARKVPTELSGSYFRTHRRDQSAAEIGQIGGRPARDQVAVDHDALVDERGAGVLEVVLDRGDPGDFAALQDAGADRHPAGVADHGDRLPVT